MSMSMLYQYYTFLSTISAQVFFIPSWQRSHDAFERHQCHGIRRERSQKTRHEASPISPRATLSIHGLRSLPPTLKPRRAVVELPAHGIRHDALLHDIAGVACEPEDLGAQAAGPEVDGGRGQARALAQQARQDVVGPPPEEEEGAEEERGGEALVDAAQAVGGVDLAHAVDGALVEAVGLVGRVLDLQARLDVLHGRRDEGDGEPGHDARDAVAEGREVGDGGYRLGGVKGGRKVTEMEMRV